MKEFALKHPFLTFFAIDAIVGGVVKIVALLTGNVPNSNCGTATETNEEELNNESAGDIQ